MKFVKDKVLECISSLANEKENLWLRVEEASRVKRALKQEYNKRKDNF